MPASSIVLRQSNTSRPAQPRIVLGIGVPPELRDALADQAVRERTTLSAIVRAALVEYLDRRAETAR